ncbi:MAG TPA: hypothetical protein VHL10_09240 [Nitrososphaera sp.]|nr:hypothetical protein [Nitrososphaera sp.]
MREAVPAFQQLQSKQPVETFDIGNMVRDLENKVKNPDAFVEEPEAEKKPEPEAEVEVPVETKVEPEAKKTSIETPLGDVDIKTPEVEQKVESEDEPEVEPELPTSQKKAKAEFVRLHKENRAFKKQVAEAEALRKEVETLRTQAPKVELEKIPEYVDLQKQLKERDEALQAREEALRTAHKIVALADFKKTPEYENSVTVPWKNKVLPAIDRLSKDKQIDANVLLSVVQNRDPASRKARFNEVVTSGEFDSFDQQALIKAMHDYDDIADRHSYLEQESVKLQEMTETERKRHFEDGQKEYRKKFDESLKAYRPKILNKWFPNWETDEELKPALAQINERIDKADWHAIPVENQAAILQAAGAAPLLEMMYSAKYQKDISERDEKIKTLENEKIELENTVKKLTKSTPSAGSGGGSSSKVDQPMEYEARNAPSIKDSIGALVSR